MYLPKSALILVGVAITNFVVDGFITIDRCSENKTPVAFTQGSLPALPNQQSTLTRPAFLRKRLDTYAVPGGWILEVGTYSSMLPVQTAAATLERFYNGVIRRSMIPTAEGHFYRLRSGNLALEFFCRQSPIPWLLVRNFARVMEMSARRGFTGRYEMYYTHVREGISIAISLYVFW